MKERIGFIGLGIMGRGMSHNLLKAGFEVGVWNRTASRMEALVEAGATAATSPADLAAQSDIIITCVSDTPDVQAVILGVGAMSQVIISTKKKVYSTPISHYIMTVSYQVMIRFHARCHHRPVQTSTEYDLTVCKRCPMF